MLDCIDCAHAMDELGPEPGMGSTEVEKHYRHLRKRVSRAAFGQDEPRGRGHKLTDVIWMKGEQGPDPSLPYPHRTLQEARRWITHLREEGIRSEEAWADHIGGLEDESGVKYPPDPRPLLRAFRALQPRLEALRKTEARVGVKHERLEAAKRAGLETRTAVYEAVAGGRYMGVDAVRKAAKTQIDRADHERKDWREIWGLNPRPGARRLYYDTEEFQRRFPEGSRQLTGEAAKAGEESVMQKPQEAGSKSGSDEEFVPEGEAS